MKIAKGEDWYRPYRVEVNGKMRFVENIHFYTEDKSILCSSGHGWLETKDGDIEIFDLPVEEIKLKRMLKFDGTIFAMTHKDPYERGELKVNLYIPAEVLDIHFVGREIEHHSSVYSYYEGSNGIFIRKHEKNINGSLYTIRNEYEKIHKELDDTSLVIDGQNIVLGKIEKLK